MQKGGLRKAERYTRTTTAITETRMTNFEPPEISPSRIEERDRAGVAELDDVGREMAIDQAHMVQAKSTLSGR